jgi:hypothetical protein
MTRKLLCQTPIPQTYINWKRHTFSYRWPFKLGVREYLHQYQTFEEAQARLPTFLEDVYNAKWLHSSLAYVPPDEFELKYAMCERLSGLDFLGALHCRKRSKNRVWYSILFNELC